MPPVSGDLATSIQQGWTGFLDLVSKVVNPDWGAIIALIPLLIAPLVALLLLAMLGRWTVFGLLKPRAKVRHVEGARAMERATGTASSNRRSERRSASGRGSSARSAPPARTTARISP